MTSPATVAFVGNPNTGKSTLFNALSGLRQRVGNYPGVTVELKKGHAAHDGVTLGLIDLPGTYSLAARSPDEMVTVDLLLGQRPEEPRPDVVVSIVDASNLERHLYLTTQAMELGVPVVVALNMVDVAEAQGIRVDAAKLANRLGVPVVPIQANKGKGLDELKRAIVAAGRSAPSAAAGPTFPPHFEEEVAALAGSLNGGVPRFLARRAILDVGGYIEHRLGEAHGPTLAERVRGARERLAAAGCAVPAIEARTRYGWIRQATQGCVTRPAARVVTWTDRIDRVLTHKVWGTLVFLAVMFLVFQAIFTWAQPLMGLIGSGTDWVAEQIRGAITPGPLQSLLADGVVKGVGGVVVFLPQILILFAFIAVLEDCGYMARAAFLMDRLMARCGLNGKSFIPLLSSMACAIPGIMAARVIENRRDRLATILVAPLMSCSARLPLYVLLIGAFFTDPWWLPGLVMFGMYMLGIVVAPLVALLLKRTLLRGETPLFLLEMPAYRWPTVGTVARRMGDAGWAFVYRAGTLILASMVLVWALLFFPATAPDGRSYPAEVIPEHESAVEQLNGQKAELESAGQDVPEELQAQLDEAQGRLDEAYGDWKRNSYLGRAGRALEPAFAPLGWDWRIGMAALASFPAREVVVGTLGIIYNQGEVDARSVREAEDAGSTPLGQAIRKEWSANPYRVATALSLLVFFALCCQCASTLAVIRRETRSWLWPLFTFTYMTALAYVAALVVFQVGKALTGVSA